MAVGDELTWEGSRNHAETSPFDSLETSRATQHRFASSIAEKPKFLAAKDIFP